MTKLRLLLIFIFIANNVSAQVERKITYLDGDNRVVDEKTFNNLKKSFIAKNDSLNIYKAVTQRTERGEISFPDEIYKRLKHIKEVDSLKPLILVFYPGKDPCNTSGSATPSSIKEWYDDLSRVTFKIAKVKPIHLYKTKDGLKKYRELEWHKDPEGIVEQTFFNFHYPCSSYVILKPDGDYIAFFGEFAKEGVITHLKELTSKK